MIPIGAYAPRSFMKSMHVNPSEAIEIHRDIQSKKSFAMHWGTFPLTAEPILEPPQRLRVALKKSGLPIDSFLTPVLGETTILRLPDSITQIK